jgi:GNAT superfamily N-acetyltransferase
VDIERITPDDDAAVRTWAEIRSASAAHDAPWEHPLTETFARGELTHGWDGEPELAFLGTVDGEPVAVGSLEVSERDNLDLAWFSVDVRPDRRRQGHGGTVLAHLEAEAARRGRTSVGISCWDVEGLERFALDRGYERKAAGINRRQHLAEVDPDVVDALHAEAAAAAADYELVRRLGRVPDDELDAVAVLTASINDAPKEGLQVEDNVFDAERVRAYDVAQEARGFVLHRLVARHRVTGELAGQTAVAVELERPHLAEQHDTSVVAAHRGHRLGALLKTGMLQWLRETQPQIAEIDTWNAESNAFMIGVNEALGYRVMGRGLDLQKKL